MYQQLSVRVCEMCSQWCAPGQIFGAGYHGGRGCRAFRLGPWRGNAWGVRVARWTGNAGKATYIYIYCIYNLLLQKLSLFMFQCESYRKAVEPSGLWPVIFLLCLNWVASLSPSGKAPLWRWWLHSSSFRPEQPGNVDFGHHHKVRGCCDGFPF